MRIFNRLFSFLNPFKSRPQTLEQSLRASVESGRAGHAYDTFEYETKSQLALSAARSPSRAGLTRAQARDAFLEDQVELERDPNGWILRQGGGENLMIKWIEEAAAKNPYY